MTYLVASSAVREYLNLNPTGSTAQYSDATIDQFIGIAEKVSGKPLHDLFQQWIFTPARPALAGSFAAHTTPVKPRSVTEIDRTQALLASTKH